MRHLILLPALLLAACATTPRTALAPVASAPYPPACAVRFPANPNMAAWSADKFAGSYRSGAHELIVRREGNTLIVRQPDKLPTQITSAQLQSWLFRDGCGTSYQFMLPPDGRGARLTITVPAGTRTQWNRRG